MSKNRKKLAFATAILVTALIFTGVFYKGRVVPKPPAGPMGEASPTPEALTVNFRESGQILNWDVQTESYTDEWTFLYEKPTNPAIRVDLTFDENSLCDMGDGYQPCDQSIFTNGDFVELEGNRTGREVTVVRLKKLDLGIPVEP